jgi:hypothetical protein
MVDRSQPVGQLVLVTGKILDHQDKPGYMPYRCVDLGASGPYRLQSRLVGWVKMAG